MNQLLNPPQTEGFTVSATRTLNGSSGTEVTIVVSYVESTSGTLVPYDRLRQRFETLAEVWHRNTAHLSSPGQIASDQAYRMIVEMGRQTPTVVIGWILGDLREHGGEWYRALREIAPNPPRLSREDLLDYDRTIAAWLRWGREQGFLAD